VNAVAPGVIETDISNFAKNRNGPKAHARDAGSEAHWKAGGPSRRHCFPVFGPGALDHWRTHSVDGGAKL